MIAFTTFTVTAQAVETGVEIQFSTNVLTIKTAIKDRDQIEQLVRELRGEVLPDDEDYVGNADFYIEQMGDRRVFRVETCEPPLYGIDADICISMETSEAEQLATLLESLM